MIPDLYDLGSDWLRDLTAVKEKAHHPCLEKEDQMVKRESSILFAIISSDMVLFFSGYPFGEIIEN